jgi:hypothetical protein
MSVVFVAVGTLLALWDQLFGVRLRQGDMEKWRDRGRHALKERRLTILGSVLVLASIPVEVAGW